jgi:EAL domain-containing protein (putative c-di-GMP-specific phosphodiesterase class I)
MDDFVVKMEQIRELGISFALDDFGTGYSSLSYLKKLPINELKIDRSFIQDIGIDKNDEAIVQTIIQMGHTLGIDVLAEGVETVEQYDILRTYGCHNYQGYLFGRPVRIDEYEREFIELRKNV